MMTPRANVDALLDEIAKAPESTEAKGVALQGIIVHLLLDIRDLLKDND